jgi:translocation and assembly module TamA
MPFTSRIRSFLFLVLLLQQIAFIIPYAVWADEPLRLEIQGVSGEVLDNVRAALSFPPGMVRNGTVDRRWLARFVNQAQEVARRALQPFGYYSSTLRTELITEKPGVEVLRVTIDPGPPVRLTQVHTAIEGPGAESLRRRDLLRDFPLQQGEVLHQGLYEEVKKNWQDQAMALGYLDASFPVREIRIDPEKNTAEINLVMETGPRYRFGNVTFKGGETYPEPFLRRYLAFEHGNPFSYSLLGQSQLNFFDSDRFEEVRLLPDREAAEEDHIPVEVALRSRPPKRLRPGIGYGTDTGARASLQFENLNLLHTGQELHLQLNLSQVRQTVGAAYVRPDKDDLHSFTAFRTGFEAEDTDTFDTEKYTVEAERVRDFGRGRRGSVYLRLLLENYTIGGQRDTSRMLIPGVRYSRRRYAEVIRPRRGHQYALEVRGGHQYLGSDTGLLQLLGSGNVLVSLPARFSLFLRAEAGTTIQNEPLEDIPVSLRFFAGGDQSVRGYGYQSLGPTNAEGDVIGGKNLLVGSIELERAIAQNWGVAAFFDIGNAFNSFSSMDLFKGAGIGGRYYTPVGPIKLDIARQIGEDDPSFRIHISVGFGW